MHIKFNGIGWLGLRKTGGSQLVKTTYIWFFLVPIAAQILSEVPAEFKLPMVEESITLNLGLPFSWHVFYFAALSFLIGSLVFQWKCPPIIRDFEDFADYMKRDGSPAYLILEAVSSQRFDIVNNPRNCRNFLESFLEIEKDDEWIEMLSRIKDYPDMLDEFEGVPRYMYSFIGYRKAKPEKLADTFRAARNAKSSGEALWRHVCGAFFGIGFVGLIVIGVQNFHWVFRSFLSSVGR